MLLEFFFAASTAEVEHSAVKFRFVLCGACLYQHPTNRVLDFLREHQQSRLQLRCHRLRAFHLDDFSENADRDLLGRGCENVEPGWRADLAEPCCGYPSVTQVFELLTCLRFAGDKCHV